MFEAIEVQSPLPGAYLQRPRDGLFLGLSGFVNDARAAYRFASVAEAEEAMTSDRLREVCRRDGLVVSSAMPSRSAMAGVHGGSAL